MIVERHNGNVLKDCVGVELNDVEWITVIVNKFSLQSLLPKAFKTR